MLGKICPEATPTPEDSGMSFIEESGTHWENLVPDLTVLSRFASLQNLT